MLLCLGVERGEVVEVGGFVLFLVDSIVVLRNSKVQEDVLAPGPLRRGLGFAAPECQFTPTWMSARAGCCQRWRGVPG